MLLLQEDRLARARQTLDGAWRARLEQESALAQAQPVVTVLDKAKVAASGDKRDYFSVGPYWWPNPETPDGLPYVRRDGQRNPETLGGDNPAIRSMVSTVTTLVMAAHYLGDNSAAQDAARRLRAWFLDDATGMHPHLEYAQAIPGHCEGRGIGIIDTVPCRMLPDLTALLATSGAWSAADDEALRQWFGRYTRWLLESSHGHTEAGEHNNHGSWYDAQVATFALYSGQPEAAEAILARVPQVRFAPHVAPDGAQPYELARTLSFSYSCFNLLAFFDMAHLGERVGLKLWEWRGEAGQTLATALEYLRPYLDTRETWPHPQITPDDGAALLALVRRWHAKQTGSACDGPVPSPGGFTAENTSLPQIHSALLWP